MDILIIHLLQVLLLHKQDDKIVISEIVEIIPYSIFPISYSHIYNNDSSNIGNF